MIRALIITASLLFFLATACIETRPAALRVEAPAHELPADGASSLVLRLRVSDGQSITTTAIDARLLEGGAMGTVLLRDAAGGTVEAVYRAGVLPGPVTIRLSGRQVAPTDISLLLTPSPGDSFGDGTPDFLRLDSAADRQAFRRWFTLIAEHEALLAAADLSPQQAQQRRLPGTPLSPQQAQQRRLLGPSVPAEINDCAALLRFAYRESMRRHDGRWMAEMHFAAAPAVPDIAKYEYPHTPLGPRLFRIHQGGYQPADLEDGSFAEFADARTLLNTNTHFISRDVRKALPGDLLFYRQIGQRSPFHSMIYVGVSAAAMADAGPASAGAKDWVVYHTGRIGNNPGDATPASAKTALAGDPGELRRATISTLARHPDPRWHPVPQNPNFLGVYRWNILREAN
ncbi:MAG: DUF1175 family protein [Candidatus Korobacteraceae bacterium]|jgi:uncharacterized protein YfaT (DUF1175 family)